MYSSIHDISVSTATPAYAPPACVSAVSPQSAPATTVVASAWPCFRRPHAHAALTEGEETASLDALLSAVVHARGEGGSRSCGSHAGGACAAGSPDGRLVAILRAGDAAPSLALRTLRDGFATVTRTDAVVANGGAGGARARHALAWTPQSDFIVLVTSSWVSCNETKGADDGGVRTVADDDVGDLDTVTTTLPLLDPRARRAGEMEHVIQVIDARCDSVSSGCIVAALSTSARAEGARVDAALAAWTAALPIDAAIISASVLSAERGVLPIVENIGGREDDAISVAREEARRGAMAQLEIEVGVATADARVAVLRLAFTVSRTRREEAAAGSTLGSAWEPMSELVRVDLRKAALRAIDLCENANVRFSSIPDVECAAVPRAAVSARAWLAGATTADFSVAPATSADCSVARPEWMVAIGGPAHAAGDGSESGVAIFRAPPSLRGDTAATHAQPSLAFLFHPTAKPAHRRAREGASFHGMTKSANRGDTPPSLGRRWREQASSMFTWPISALSYAPPPDSRVPARLRVAKDAASLEGADDPSISAAAIVERSVEGDGARALALRARAQVHVSAVSFSPASHNLPARLAIVSAAGALTVWMLREETAGGAADVEGSAAGGASTRRRNTASAAHASASNQELTDGSPLAPSPSRIFSWEPFSLASNSRPESTMPGRSGSDSDAGSSIDHAPALRPPVASAEWISSDMLSVTRAGSAHIEFFTVRADAAVRVESLDARWPQSADAVIGGSPVYALRRALADVVTVSSQQAPPSLDRTDEWLAAVAACESSGGASGTAASTAEVADDAVTAAVAAATSTAAFTVARATRVGDALYIERAAWHGDAVAGRVRLDHCPALLRLVSVSVTLRNLLASPTAQVRGKCAVSLADAVSAFLSPADAAVARARICARSWVETARDARALTLSETLAALPESRKAGCAGVTPSLASSLLSFRAAALLRFLNAGAADELASFADLITGPLPTAVPADSDAATSWLALSRAALEELRRTGCGPVGAISALAATVDAAAMRLRVATTLIDARAAAGVPPVPFADEFRALARDTLLSSAVRAARGAGPAAPMPDFTALRVIFRASPSLRPLFFAILSHVRPTAPALWPDEELHGVWEAATGDGRLMSAAVQLDAVDAFNAETDADIAAAGSAANALLARMRKRTDDPPFSLAHVCLDGVPSFTDGAMTKLRAGLPPRSIPARSAALNIADIAALQDIAAAPAVASHWAQGVARAIASRAGVLDSARAYAAWGARVTDARAISARCPTCTPDGEEPRAVCPRHGAEELADASTELIAFDSACIDVVSATPPLQLHEWEKLSRDARLLKALQTGDVESAWERVSAVAEAAAVRRGATSTLVDAARLAANALLGELPRSITSRDATSALSDFSAAAARVTSILVSLKTVMRELPEGLEEREASSPMTKAGVVRAAAAACSAFAPSSMRVQCALRAIFHEAFRAAPPIPERLGADVDSNDDNSSVSSDGSVNSVDSLADLSEVISFILMRSNVHEPEDPRPSRETPQQVSPMGIAIALAGQLARTTLVEESPLSLENSTARFAILNGDKTESAAVEETLRALRLVSPSPWSLGGVEAAIDASARLPPAAEAAIVASVFFDAAIAAAQIATRAPAHASLTSAISSKSSQRAGTEEIRAWAGGLARQASATANATVRFIRAAANNASGVGVAGDENTGNADALSASLPFSAERQHFINAAARVRKSLPEKPATWAARESAIAALIVAAMAPATVATALFGPSARFMYAVGARAVSLQYSPGKDALNSASARETVKELLRREARKDVILLLAAQRVSTVPLRGVTGGGDVVADTHAASVALELLGMRDGHGDADLDASVDALRSDLEIRSNSATRVARVRETWAEIEAGDAGVSACSTALSHAAGDGAPRAAAAAVCALLRRVPNAYRASASRSSTVASTGTPYLSADASPPRALQSIEASAASAATRVSGFFFSRVDDALVSSGLSIVSAPPPLVVSAAAVVASNASTREPAPPPAWPRDLAAAPDWLLRRAPSRAATPSLVHSATAASTDELYELQPASLHDTSTAASASLTGLNVRAKLGAAFSAISFIVQASRGATIAESVEHVDAIPSATAASDGAGHTDTVGGSTGAGPAARHRRPAKLETTFVKSLDWESIKRHTQSLASLLYYDGEPRDKLAALVAPMTSRPASLPRSADLPRTLAAVTGARPGARVLRLFDDLCGSAGSNDAATVTAARATVHFALVTAAAYAGDVNAAVELTVDFLAESPPNSATSATSARAAGIAAFAASRAKSHRLASDARAWLASTALAGCDGGDSEDVEGVDYDEYARVFPTTSELLAVWREAEAEVARDAEDDAGHDAPPSSAAAALLASVLTYVDTLSTPLGVREGAVEVDTILARQQAAAWLHLREAHARVAAARGARKAAARADAGALTAALASVEPSPRDALALLPRSERARAARHAKNAILAAATNARDRFGGPVAAGTLDDALLALDDIDESGGGRVRTLLDEWRELREAIAEVAMGGE